jgi:transposase InsO family protein
VNEFEFIAAKKAQYPIEVLCDVLEVSRAGFYAHHGRPKSKRATRDEVLGEKIAAIHKEGRRAYGSPRVYKELVKLGEHVSRKRVIRLMQERDLRGKRRRHFHTTTDSDHAMPVASNILARDFSASAPNQKWVGDITYIPTREGWLYLATLLDLFSRRVVGWSMSDRMPTSLPLAALEMALRMRRPPRGLVHHTDRGSQYASAEYQSALAKHGLVASMSRKGNCWDNAVAESFFATLKVELVRDADFATRAEARAAVFEYIEVFYNRQRLHSSIGYATPSEFEFDFENVRKAA